MIYKIFYPFFKFLHWLSLKISNVFYRVIALKDLINENSELNRENRRLLLENVSLKEMARENSDLRKLLNFPLEPKQKLILADVIGYSSQNLGQYILINKGIKDDLEKDLAVVDQDGALVVKNIEVNDRFAKILLISDPNSLINAIIQNEKRTQGIIKGEYGLTLSLEMIPLDEKIEKDQVVITAGLGGIFSKGLIIGKIQEIIFRENEVFQKAIIKPAADFRRLERVIILPR